MTGIKKPDKSGFFIIFQQINDKFMTPRRFDPRDCQFRAYCHHQAAL
mgnify:CR=1 FL=1